MIFRVTLALSECAMSAPRDEKYFIDEGGVRGMPLRSYNKKILHRKTVKKNTLGKQASEIVTWIETFCTN